MHMCILAAVLCLFKSKEARKNYLNFVNHHVQEYFHAGWRRGQFKSLEKSF